MALPNQGHRRLARGLGKARMYTFDVEEPNAPTLPLLTAISQTELELQWTLSTDDGGTPITGHQVRIVAGTSIPANTPWVDTGSTDTEHTFTELTPGTQYTAQVRAVNAVGPGTASSATSLSTMARITVALTAPSSGLSGTDVTIQITATQADVNTLAKLVESCERSVYYVVAIGYQYGCYAPFQLSVKNVRGIARLRW